jgi:hypothetical protein
LWCPSNVVPQTFFPEFWAAFPWKLSVTFGIVCRWACVTWAWLWSKPEARSAPLDWDLQQKNINCIKSAFVFAACVFISSIRGQCR